MEEEEEGDEVDDNKVVAEAVHDGDGDGDGDGDEAGADVDISFDSWCRLKIGVMIVCI